jgi:DNA-binding protein HU-beta
MSKAFITEAIRQSTDVSGATANRAAGELINAIVQEMKKPGSSRCPASGPLPFAKPKRARH